MCVCVCVCVLCVFVAFVGGECWEVCYPLSPALAGERGGVVVVLTKASVVELRPLGIKPHSSGVGLVPSPCVALLCTATQAFTLSLLGVCVW